MRRKLVWALALAMALELTGCGGLSAAPVVTAAPPQPKSQVAFFFDTVVTMNIYTEDEKLLSDAQAECRRYENLLSKTVEGSDVWNLNHAEGERIPVSPETREILEKALEYSALSEGAFDVTIGSCVDLWDFTGEGMGVLPDETALARAADKVGWAQIDMNEEGVLLPAGVTIDLGAIAKGYITDRIADFMRERGVESGFLNFGGNVLVIGGKPDGTDWNIGIQDPRGIQQQTIVGAVPVRDQAVVTSGIYERGFDLDGVRYHHILDTATGWPVQNELAGVSIIAPDAFDADTLSTTVFAMGVEKGTAFIESLEGIEAIFVTREDEVTWTSGLEGRFQPA